MPQPFSNVNPQVIANAFRRNHARPRKELISSTDTPYYHCVSRCVRRAYLCGRSENFDFEHRRGWIVSRIKQLAAVFCIDVAAYAVMSNHYHVVLRINKETGGSLTDDEVIARWRQLFKGPYLIQQYVSEAALGGEELRVVAEIAANLSISGCPISFSGCSGCPNSPLLL